MVMACSRGDGHGAVAGVAGGGGHLEDVLVEGAPGLVDGDRRQALDLGVRRDHRDPVMPWSASAVRAAISATCTESGSLGSTTTSAAPQAVIASRSLAGRRPAARRRPRRPRRRPRANSAARPGPAATATIRRPRRWVGLLAGAGDLLGEVGDPHPVRAAGLDPGLDRGTDVVDVHVDVPQSLATDDDQRVAERGEGAPQLGDPVVVGVEEVHHLVGRSVGGEVVGGHRRDGDVARPRSGSCTGAGRRPVSTVSAASRITLRPRPPASTTPASRSTASCSGVRARASRAAPAAQRRARRGPDWPGRPRGPSRRRRPRGPR